MGSTVCNAGVKSSLLSDGQLGAGKAANLFSASRRFRALAFLAGAHSGIVFLLLHLSLLPSNRKSWMFTELAAPNSFSADRHGVFVARGFFWLTGVLLGKHTNSFSYVRATTEPPMGRQTESSHSPAGKGNIRAKVLALLAWAELSLALPEVDSIQRKHALQLSATSENASQIRTFGGSYLGLRLPVGDTSKRTEMTARGGGDGDSKMSFLASCEAPSLFSITFIGTYQWHVYGEYRKRNSSRCYFSVLLVRTFIIM